MKSMYITMVVIVLIIILAWLGLQLKPAPFPPYSGTAVPAKTIPLPKNLPAPVERFYRTMYGDAVPVITSAVFTGRATMRPVGGISLPARFRFTHVAGVNYRHYIEATFFGFPIMKVNERYLDGHALMELPFGTDEGEHLNQAANLGLWSESIWMPAIFLTDPRVHWETIDDNSALLAVPFEEGQDHFIVRFDPQSGLISWFESMRYHDSKSPAKVLWMNQVVEWSTRNGKPFAASGAATWMDDGKPWAVFTVEDAAYNVDVEQYIRSKGL
jgi:hypothetical protein